MNAATLVPTGDGRRDASFVRVCLPVFFISLAFL